MRGKLTAKQVEAIVKHVAPRYLPLISMFFHDRNTGELYRSPNDVYWGRVLACVILLGYASPTRIKLANDIAPNYNLCYHGHPLGKNTHPHDCPLCDF